MSHQLVDLRITGIAAGGAGVGRAGDGRVVFVQRSAPGDQVRVELIEVRNRWARGRLVEVLDAGPGRSRAPCPHYPRCGGCTLQHLEYRVQLEAKQTLVADALGRIGGLEVPRPVAITGSPARFHYRNRLSFELRRRGVEVSAGLHALDEPFRLVDIDDGCLLPEPAVARAWAGLRAAWGPQAMRLPAGARLRLTLRAAADGATTLLIAGGRGRGDPDSLLASVPGLQSIWHAPEPGTGPLLLAGVEEVVESWGEDRVGLSAGLFLQVNRGTARLLEEYVVGAAAREPPARVVDAYCGVGLYARRLARAGAAAVGLELDPLAVRQARRGAPPGASFLQGKVEELLPASLPADLLILNPPRTGTVPEALAAILERPPGRIIYVSCDPATLARDLARLAAGFGLRSLCCFDLFPQTSHVETVAELTCCTT